MESRKAVAKHDETTSRKFCSRFEVYESERFTYRYVIFRFEVESRWLTPTSNLFVTRLVRTVGYGVVQKIRQSRQHGVEIDLNRALQLDVDMPFVDDLGSVGAFVSTANLDARIGGVTTLDIRKGVPTMKGELDVATGRLKMLGRRFDVDEGRITFTGANISEPRLDITAGGTVGNVPITATVSGTPSAPGITPECDGYPSQADCLMILISKSMH